MQLPIDIMMLLWYNVIVVREEFSGLSEEQMEIAEEFGLSAEEAARVNPKKAEAYRAYLASPQAKLERFLDGLDEDRRKYINRMSNRFQRYGWKKLANKSLRG